MKIFCHNCGKKIEEEDKFCDFCGAEILINQSKNRLEQKTLKHGELEKRAWYRAIKVVYIVIVIIAIILVAGISWSEKPEKTIDGYNSIISCSNGKSYAPSKNQIYLYNYETELNYSDDKDARILCKYDTLSFYKYSDEFIEKNYTFIPDYNDVDYGSWIGYMLLSFAILWVVSYLIKIGFFYIAIGEKPRFNIFKK